MRKNEGLRLSIGQFMYSCPVLRQTYFRFSEIVRRKKALQAAQALTPKWYPAFSVSQICKIGSRRTRVLPRMDLQLQFLASCLQTDSCLYWLVTSKMNISRNHQQKNLFALIRPSEQRKKITIHICRSSLKECYNRKLTTYIIFSRGRILLTVKLEVPAEKGHK